MSGRVWSQAISGLAALLIWQAAASIVGPRSFVPSPLDTARALWLGRLDYLPHTVSTLGSAAIGFLGGGLVALLIASLLVLLPQLDFLLAPCTFVFSIPLIVLVPLIGMTASPAVAPALCAGLLVYYPILLLTLTGMRHVDPTLLAFALSAGGDRWNIFRRIRIRYAVIGFLAGVQSAIPVAILGAMLGEFTGARWGLGSYLLAIMAQGNAPQEWAIFIFCACLAGIIYWSATVMLRRNITESQRPSTPAHSLGTMWRIAASIVATLVLWQIAALAVDNAYFFKGPYDLVRIIAQAPWDQTSAFLQALWETLKWVSVGLVVGVASGLALALALQFYPVIRGPAMLCAFISQVVPIIALIPLYVAVFGRGTLTTIAITLSATFFLSFTSIHEGLEQAPASLIAVALAAGSSDAKVLLKVRLPAAIPFLFAAVRLSAPRVFLGVTLAEYLATRRGLGALLFEARGKLDFGTMWTIAVCAGIVSILITEGVRYCEIRSIHRFAEEGTRRVVALP